MTPLKHRCSLFTGLFFTIPTFILKARPRGRDATGSTTSVSGRQGHKHRTVIGLLLIGLDKDRAGLELHGGDGICGMTGRVICTARERARAHASRMLTDAAAERRQSCTSAAELKTDKMQSIKVID